LRTTSIQYLALNRRLEEHKQQSFGVLEELLGPVSVDLQNLTFFSFLETSKNYFTSQEISYEVSQCR